VRHESGGVSIIGIKSYQRGVESFQGETIDWMWFDEEPPLPIYTEGLTRTNVKQGPVWMTFTPLLGMSATVTRFLQEKGAGRAVITMTIDDALHAASSLLRKSGLQLSQENSRATGLVSGGWISAGTILSPRSNWSGIATLTRCT
jgi:phage terminase large subunit-like protein